jgi:hypothetical protein
MSNTRRSFNLENGVQKGPGTDASFITEMRRKQSVITGATLLSKEKPQMVDNLKARGTDVNPITTFMSKGITLSFLKTY